MPLAQLRAAVAAGQVRTVRIFMGRAEAITDHEIRRLKALAAGRA